MDQPGLLAEDAGIIAKPYQGKGIYLQTPDNAPSLRTFRERVMRSIVSVSVTMITSAQTPIFGLL